MARFLFFWILLISSFCLKAQQHFAEHSGNQDLTEGMACINNKCFFIERMDLPYYGILNLVGVDQSGLPFLKKQLLPGDAMPFEGRSEIKKTLDEHLVCTYQASHSCDVIGGQVYFSKLDTNGNFIFTATLPGALADFIQYSDSSYYLLGFNGHVTGNVIRHVSKNGQVIESFTTTGSYFTCLTELNNGNLFLSGTTAFCEMDTSFNYLQIVPSNTSLSSCIQSNSGKCYGLGPGGKMLTLSPNYAILNQSQLAGIEISDFVYLKDTLYVTGYNTINQSPYYAMLDTAFNAIYQSSNSLSSIRPKAIDLSADNKVSISARSLWYTAFGRACFRIPKSGDFSLSTDIGVTAISPLVLTEVNKGMYEGEFDVTVKNFGNQPVNGFNLNTNVWFMICPYTWQKQYDTIIPPQSSVVVKTGTLYVMGNLQGGSANHKDRICFYSSAGGNKAELNLSNDFLCDSLSYEALSIGENQFPEAGVSVFPNPVSGNLNVETKFELKKIELLNNLSQVVYSQLRTGKEADLNIEEFEVGVYVIRIETEKGITCKKLIKTR